MKLADWLLPGGVSLTVEAAGNELRLRHGAGAAEALVAALRSEPVPAPFRVVQFAPLPDVEGERAITADQTNESVVVGERLIVKWLPRPERRVQPAPLVLAHLTEAGFTATARPYAALFLDTDVEVLLALVVEYLPDAVDGWDWCVDDLLGALAERPYAVARAATFPAELGRLTAQLHAAFATPSAVVPTPLGAAGARELGEWAQRATAAAGEAVDRTAPEGAPDPDEGVHSANAGRVAAAEVGLGADRRWLRANAARITGALAPLAELATVPAVSTPTLPIHGDLHVGQVLRWRDGYALVDFDGNPVVPVTSSESSRPTSSIKREPAARDVVQMLMSLDHVGRIADRRTAGLHSVRIVGWISTAQQQFIDAYRSELSARSLSDLLDGRLLEPFAVEQECRELLYAARFLPRWRYAPMGALRAMFPDQSGAL
jgi:maltokinase